MRVRGREGGKKRERERERYTFGRGGKEWERMTEERWENIAYIHVSITHCLQGTYNVHVITMHLMLC